MMFYRDDLLRRIPGYDKLIGKLDESITWEEFIELGKYFDPKINPLYFYPADDYEGLICSYFELILNKDRNFFNNKPIDFYNNTAFSSLQFLVDLVNKYNVSPSMITQFKENSCYQNFIDQNGVFVRGWPSFERNIMQNSDNLEIAKHIKKAALPHRQGSGNGSIFGGWNLMIAKFSEHKPEVVKFIEYASSDEAQEIMFAEGSFLPIKSGFYNDKKYLQKYPEFRYLKELMDKGIHRPYFDDYTRISDIISYYAHKAIKMEMTVEQALFEANEIIKENKVIIK